MKLLYALALLATLGLVLTPLSEAGNQDKAAQEQKGKQKDKGETKPGDNLDGVWTVASVEVAGKKVPNESAKLTVKGNTFTLDIGGKSIKGTYKADASKTPKEVTSFFDDGMNNKIQIDSIYELKGDTMRVCGGLGKDRPKEFSSTPENGYELVTYKRAK